MEKKRKELGRRKKVWRGVKKKKKRRQKFVEGKGEIRRVEGKAGVPFFFLRLEVATY